MRSESHLNSEYQVQQPGFFDQRPKLIAVTILVLIALACMVRIYKIHVPGLLPDRDFRSAIFARDFYFEKTDDVEAWRKDIAHKTRQNQPILEPPVTEFLVSLIYRAVGSEQLWIARLLTSSFWLVGGVFLFAIIKTVVSTDAAVFGLAYYLFNPLSVLLSRSFQPDSLMMMMFLLCLLLILKYYQDPSCFRFMMAAIISGLTLLCRPLVLFTIFGAFTSLAIHKKGTWKRFIDRHYLTFIAVSLLPNVLYYGYGILGAEFLRSQADMSFRPWLLFYKVFWKGWLDLAILAVGYTALTGALLGMPMLQKGLPKALVVGLGIGYIVFGLVFNQHIHTHGYYHSQLIPIVAISFGPAVILISNKLKAACNKWYGWLPVIVFLLLGMLFTMQQVRNRVGSARFESKEVAREIGEIVNHSTRTVWLAPMYGVPLQYYGELTGAYWPRRINYWLYRLPGERELSIEERLNALDFSPEYFVIIDFHEFNKHHSDLKEFLKINYSLIAGSDKYLIYGIYPK
jgi:hypothetical protein